MSEPKDLFLERIKIVGGALADGFQLADLAAIVGEACEIAETLEDLDGSSKRAVAIRLIERVIDETDTPWLPDALVDPLLKVLVPSFVDVIVGASKGGLAVNEKDEDES